LIYYIKNIIFILYNVLCDKDEKFNIPENYEKNWFIENKFSPKSHVWINKKPYMPDNIRKIKEQNMLNNKVYPRNFGYWKHDKSCKHNNRNVGYSSLYHNKKHHQFTPSIPNVSNKWESISEISPETLTHFKNYPTLEVPDNFQGVYKNDPYIY
jgi:hypothetical protein